MDEDNEQNFKESGITYDSVLASTREPSMTSLLAWNISKARENNPSLDLKAALNDVQERLNGDSCNYNNMASLHPKDRHLVCALLAWYELGHESADSLFEFAEARGKTLQSNKQSCNLRKCLFDNTKMESQCLTDKKYTQIVDNSVNKCLSYISSKKAIYCCNKTASIQVFADIKNSMSSNFKFNGNSKYTNDNANNVKNECQHDEVVFNVKDSTNYKTEGNSQFTNDKGENIKDTNKIIHANVVKPICRYVYMNSRNQMISDIKDTPSSQYETEGKSLYTVDKNIDIKNTSDEVFHTNVKKPTCRYDYIMTPINQTFFDIKDTTSSQYETEGKLQYTMDKVINIKNSSEHVFHINVKKPACRHDYIMNPRIQTISSIKDATFFQYKADSNLQYEYDEGNNKTTRNNVKKADCAYDYIMTPRNEVGTDIKDTTSFCYKTEGNLQCTYEKAKNSKDKFDKITRNNVKIPICRYDCVVNTRNKKVGDIKNTYSDNFSTNSLRGPVVKLPTETNIIMRSENIQNVCHHKKTCKLEDLNTKSLNKKIMSKIDAACCIESACTEKLVELDKTITELRSRAGQLARREAERVELLERTEAAWKDLELGYRRRLSLGHEKEDDMAKQANKLIEERNNYKGICMNLTSLLKEKTETAEKDRDKLIALEKEICDFASIRLRLSQDFASGDAALVEHHIKAVQLDRDFQFKEDQARRNSSSIESEVDAACALALETERALRSELCSLKAQIKQQSEQLLSVDSENCKIKMELQDLLQEKSDMIEDMESCQGACDGHIQDKLDELKKKRVQLSQLKSIVTECKCKLPMDEAVEVKRTPSLATLCKCMPDENILDKCSCTSLRGQLLTNLFEDLFSGLQDELSGSGSMMPCQLLKCLEDKHNWDRSSVVKNNLRSFFSQLLLGELDIAIATAIEKYHATWIGGQCVGAKKTVDGYENYDEEQCDIECRAQKLAFKLAEQLYNERADELIQRAKDIVNSSPPLCDCKQQTTAVYPCLVQQPAIYRRNPTSMSTPHSHWRKTSYEVTQNRARNNDLKKVPENTTIAIPNIEKRRYAVEDSNEKQNRTHKYLNTKPTQLPHSQKLSSVKKKLDVSSKKRVKNLLNVSNHMDKSSKLYKNLGQTYAVNVCLCEKQKEPPMLDNQEKSYSSLNYEYKTICKQKQSKYDSPDMSGNVKQTKPISVQIPSISGINVIQNKTPIDTSCINNYPCFHKNPSNSSINRLLDFLAKWQKDLKTKDCDQFLIKKSLHSLNELKLNMSPENKSECVIISCSALNPLKKSEIENALPTIESDYMGAINLHKSSYCLCNPTKEIVGNIDSVNDKIMQDSIERYQYSDAKCIQSMEIKEGTLNCNSITQHHSSLSKNDQFINQSLKSEKMFQNSLIKNAKSNPVHNKIETNIAKTKQKVNVSKENTMESGIHHAINSSKTFPCDHDCYIKFLGVTLTNNSFPKGLKKIKTNCHVAKNLENIKEPIITQKINCEHTNNMAHMPVTSNLDNAVCQCEINLDNLKKNINKTFRRPEEFYNGQSSKAYDIESFKDNLVDIQENCVCCNTVLRLDESIDLEVNTFNLLKDHLKGRLEKLKKYWCNFCISSVEEEKMYSSLLQKVKEVISDCANKIKYTGTEEDQKEYSWNRAHSLLQEYVTLKIRRAQCICVANEERKQELSILPNVLDQVYNLIEDDFQRLKTICKCRCNDTQLHKRDEKYKRDRDNNGIDNNSQVLNENIFLNGETIQIETGNIEAVCKASSNKSIIPTQNLSVQVSNNLSMETRSCDAMEKGNKNIQTTEAIKPISNKYCNFIKPAYDCDCNLNVKTDSFLFHPCANDVKLFDDAKYLPDSQKLCYSMINGVKCDNLPEMQQNFYVDRNERIQILDGTPVKENNNANVICSHVTAPYIGYTMDCSCNGNLCTETCIKSTIIQNNDQINIILKNTKEKSQVQNISYIMDSVPKVSRTKCNVMDKWSINDTDNINNISSFKNTRDSKLSVRNEEEIFLKESNTNLNISCNAASTSDPKMNLDTNSVQVHVLKNTIIEHNKQHKLKQIHKQDTNKQHYSIFRENTVRSEPFLKNTTKNSEIHTSECDCTMVPICHVKMLVQNIENKLIHSKCTCDSLNPKVCPVHSN